MIWSAVVAWTFLSAVGSLPGRTAEETIRSPDGSVAATLGMEAGKGPRIVVLLGGREVVRCEGLGLDFVDGPGLGADLEVLRRRRTERREAWEHPFGKRRDLLDHHREAVWTLRERSAPGRTAELSVRVHDDGVSYRWRVIAWPGVTRARVAGERCRHVVVGNPLGYPLYRRSFRTSHEGPYTRARLDDLQPGRLIDLPLLLAHDDGRCLAYTEANVRGFPHGYLERAGDRARTLSPRLSPRLDDPRVAARVAVPFQTPWRTWMIGATVARLLESDLLLHLCDPPRSRDTSWIRPGKQTWHWWNGTVLDAKDQGGLDFATMRGYVDFCAESGIRYHAVNGERQPWYVQSRPSVRPGPDADVLVPRPELRWDALREHAAKRGVRLRLWAHWKALEPKLEAAFALYERWGVSGLMVDFLDRDDQGMVEFCERVLEVAARHRLTIQFHGSFKPTGLRRTFPHLMNHEGSANLEVLKWSGACDPDHDLIVPFTRGLAGALDYHLGGFRALRRKEFAPRNVRPHVLGTRARALAWYVVLDNPLPMVADYPGAYAGQPGFDFLTDVPTTWDRSRVLAAEIGSHIAWARCNGGRWYLGAVTSWKPRDLTLPLTFLGSGEHEMRLFADPQDRDAEPNEVSESRRRVTSRDTLRLSLAAGGGAVAVFRRTR